MKFTNRPLALAFFSLAFGSFVGFEATAKIKRSDFGLGYALPVVGDDVDLKITAAFEK